MRVQEIRDHIVAARERIDAGDTEGARQHLDLASGQLSPDTMLTTSEAAELLGIRSKNTIKAMARRGQIAAHLVGNRYRIPLAEVVRLQDVSIMRELRASERVYDAMAFPGSDDPLSEEELESLRVGEPGTLPWQR